MTSTIPIMRRAVPRAMLRHYRSQSSQPCLLCQHHISLPNPPQISQTLSSHFLSTSSAVSSQNTPQRESLVPQTHYEFFPSTLPDGPPPSSPFNIHLPTLRREFLQLQSKAHPDKFPTGPQKAQAEALSARINEAYKTLTSPLLRAQYLLSTHGIDVMSESQGSQSQDPETLMRVLEVQERLEEGDVGESEIEEMMSENNARIGESVETLGKLIEKGSWDEAGKECIRLRYWMSVKEGLDGWESGKGRVLLIH